MAVAIVVDETLIMAGAGAFPYGTNEFLVSGGLKQSPVELVKCKTLNLEVPSAAEIILEGEIDPMRRVKEGPFLDYTGSPNINPSGFVFDVSCMIYRNEPIFRGTSVGIPVAEDHILSSLVASTDSHDYHGSRIRQRIQNILIKKVCFRAFQFTGISGRYFK